MNEILFKRVNFIPTNVNAWALKKSSFTEEQVTRKLRIDWAYVCHLWKTYSESQLRPICYSCILDIMLDI